VGYHTDGIPDLPFAVRKSSARIRRRRPDAYTDTDANPDTGSGMRCTGQRIVAERGTWNRHHGSRRNNTGDGNVQLDRTGTWYIQCQPVRNEQRSGRRPGQRNEPGTGIGDDDGDRRRTYADTNADTYTDADPNSDADAYTYS
jgi:hypothetical protein